MSHKFLLYKNNYLYLVTMTASGPLNHADSMLHFEQAVAAAARLDATVIGLAGSVSDALVIRHVLLAFGGAQETARGMIVSDSGAFGTGTESGLLKALDNAELGGLLPDRVRAAIAEIDIRGGGMWDAAEAAGHIAAASPTGMESHRAAALVAALLLLRAGLVSAPFLSVWQLDASTRSAAVQIDRSQSWDAWMRGWFSLLAREAADALQSVIATIERFDREHVATRAQTRVGATDASVLSWLHDNLRFTIRDASEGLRLTVPTVGTAISRLEAAGVATELSGQRRDRVWVSTALLELIETRWLGTLHSH